jgi:hypothetical protein
MKRSDFLAFIPALSAIPLIGKNIVKTDGGIFIEKPVPIIEKANFSDFNPWDMEVQLWWKGRKIGDCYMTNFMVHNEMIETSCRDNGGATSISPGLQSIQIEATVNGPLNIYED